MKNPYEVYKRRLIYVFAIADAAHKGLLKIGDTTLTATAKNLPPNSKELDQAANKRIGEYTRTAGIKFKLLHTELAVDNKGKSFRDHDVHRLIKKHRVKVKGTTGREWFKINLDTAIKAIRAVKQGKKFFTDETSHEDFIPRPEQDDAINKTVNYFKHGDKFLWNAKMRFGKTICTLAVVRQMRFAKTIIITHRPVVNKSWLDDFDKIFGGTDYIYGEKGSALEDLIASGKKFVYFASIQDLRGSKVVNDKSSYDKNNAAFDTDWDFVIVDEAHEGTKTPLGDAVIKKIVKKKTKLLALSGTPFNLIDDFLGDNVYTWDYVMEQRAKADWDKNHFGDSNPYDELPRMNIFTYNLGKLFDYIDTEDNFFSFSEFFRTDGGKFVHEPDIKSFLNLLVKEDDNNYPFARADFRAMFKHTLWIIPGVKEGRALSKLLKRHEIFGGFEIVNVAGTGDSDDEPADALDKVRDAIDNHEYTITLSCGKLTTGVTVPEWTAVFYLAGSYYTSAANYLQTIFRVQSPCNKDGVSKQNCYVFDFAPDRTLKMLADSVKVATRAGRTKDSQRKALGELLNFCPVIAVEGSAMNSLNAQKLLQRIKHAQAERAVRNGFEDNSIYNDLLRDLTDLDLKKFDKLKKFVGTAKTAKNSKDVLVNEQGLTDEKRDGNTTTTGNPHTAQDRENARKAKVKRDAISILRGVSVRMPLLIYGADVPIDDDISIDKFTTIVDDASWAEFMPAGVTKDFFSDFIKYYDPEVFIKAGHIIRQRAKDADTLKPTERIEKIAELFATFKNPDKETVLTPYRVVKLHIDSAFDENFFQPDKKFLEINSKTGLYPLYIASKIYRARLGEFSEDDFTFDALQRTWDKIIADNLFTICKTPMAKTITRRTLLGYRAGNFNAHYFDNIVNPLKANPDSFIKSVTAKKFWGKGVGKMIFDGVTGNPPYQVAARGDNTKYSSPIYHEFIKIAYSKRLTKCASLIHPARFLFNAGDTPREFVEKFLSNEHVKIVMYEPNAKKLFSNSEIKGGLAITEFDSTKTFKPIKLFIPFDELKSIHKKAVLDNENFRPLSDIMYSRTAYSLTPKAHEDFPNAIKNFSKGNQYQMSSNVFDLIPEIFFDNKPDDGKEYIQIYGLTNRQRVFKWACRDLISAPGLLEKYKVFIPESNSAGALGEVVSTPLVGSTQTFISVGAFDTRAEADACIAYIKSKFAWALLGILKVTQHNPPATWAKVPLQDFIAASDIDWSVSIAQIDEQLYRKYGLDAAEINFIETHVKAME